MKTKINRLNCRDVFNAFLVALAHYAGLFEFPLIRPTDVVPNRLVSFPKSLACPDHDQWVHFYVEDYEFERIWRNPRRYLPALSRFNGVVLPDFSVYRDMPYVMQLWNIYRSRAIGCWLQANGVPVIPNLRWGDRRTYRCCCDGLSKGGVIAVGTLGCLSDADDLRHLVAGLRVVVKRLQPSAIVVYGAAPERVFGFCRESDIEVVTFPSQTSAAHQGNR